MRNVKSIIAKSAVCLIVFAFFGGIMGSDALAETSKVIKLRYGHHNKPLSLAQKYAQEPWVKAVEKATKGKVEITIYSGATLFKPQDAYDACVTGIADMAWGFIGMFHSRFPLTDMVTLPLLGIDNAEMGSLLAWHLYQTFPAVKDEYKEVKLLTLHTHAGAPIGTNRPVRSTQDFKGLKMRTPGGGILEFMKASGASAMAMSPDDIYLNMEKGVIEGWTIDPMGAEARKLQEVTKYYIKPNSYVGAFFIIMNKNKWDSLPSGIQEQIMSVSGEAGARFHGKAWDKAGSEGDEILINDIIKRGGESIVLAPVEVAKWQENAKGVWENEVKRWEEKGKPAGKILQEIERFVKEYK